MTEVIFSFDTEDFTSNIASDAIYEEAEILRKEGIRGGFCIVGLLAKQLKKWGRRDIKEALSHHDILSHSFGHSLHPTINEYTDIDDFNAAYNEAMRQEKEALSLIDEFTDNMKIYGACPPGNQKSYVAMYAYADMGLPIYADTYCDTQDGGGAYYCNIYHIQYTYSLEGLFKVSEDDLPKLLDELSSKKRVVLYTHPNMAKFTEFWDAVNYYKENKCEFGNWKECRRRTDEETKEFYSKIRKLIKLIKADERFNITSYSEVAEKLSGEGERIVKIKDIPFIKKSLDENFAPLSLPCSLSISDIFLSAKDFLLEKEEHICGKVYGFLENPYAIEKEVTLKREDVIKAVEKINTDFFLPTKIEVGNEKIGPGDFLRAMLCALTGEKEITLAPGPQLPSTEKLPMLKDLSLKGWVQSDDFEDKFLSDRLRIQCWTMRFPK